VRTLQRYLAREVVTATIFVLFALLAIFAFFDLVNQIDEVGRAGYTLSAAFAFVALSQPARIYELMPIAALIGTIYALSKLAASSEFTIMRVSGMSTRRLAAWIVRTGLFFVVAIYLLGELVAPPAERVAQRLRLEARGAAVAQEFRSGVWVRDVVRDSDGGTERLRFVNVRQVRPDTTVVNWRIFEFDRDYRLRSIATAQQGIYQPGDPLAGVPRGWRLADVVETRIPVVGTMDTAPSPLKTEILREPQRLWVSDLTPDIFGVLLVQPERMGLSALVQYIRHLSDNRQSSDRYEIAFWSKLFYPLAILVMMALALPFAYLHVRAGGVSLKIFSGVMIGVGFYMLNKLFAHIGLLNTWPPIAVAALPSLVVLSFALSALYWIERR